MGPASGVAILAVALLTAMPSRHADLEILERAVRDAWAVRARLLDERLPRALRAEPDEREVVGALDDVERLDRKSTRLNSSH